MRLIASLLSALTVAAALAGCSSDPTIPGKVIEGPMSFIGAVDDQDPRLAGPGIEGVRVSGVSESGPSSGATLGSATSGKEGEFELPVRIQRALLYPIELNAGKDGYVDANQTMASPGGGRKLLIILQPRSAAGGGG